MNPPPAARGSQETGFTQPRGHSFAQPCKCLDKNILLTIASNRLRNGIPFCAMASLKRAITWKGNIRLLQIFCFCFFLSLLSSKGYLCCHDSLSFCNKGAFCTQAIFPSAESFVSLESRYNTMISASCTLGCSLQL